MNRAWHELDALQSLKLRLNPVTEQTKKIESTECHKYFRRRRIKFAIFNDKGGR
jgi:hypothetical protein